MAKVMYNQLELPLLEIIERLGGKARAKEVYEELANQYNLSLEERNEKINNDSASRKWDRAIRWCRQNLKQSGLLGGNERGVWALTEKAKSFLKNAKPGVLVTVYEIIDKNNEVQGIALWGEVSSAKGIIQDGMINLIITSPPYPLLSPKEYGNHRKVDQYIEWLLAESKTFYNSLCDDGSLVLNLGPVYQKGLPVQSLYMHELVISLCKEIGFYLAQEFYSHNKGKLPTSYWVTVERNRVTSSIEPVFWLSKTPYPKANNRKVLQPYSESYKKVLKRGGYPVAKRPSGHVIDHFNKDNGGKIPSNLLVTNSVSNDRYIRYCKSKNLPIHPARFASSLPAFFIEMCTDEQDIVWDAFGGSNVVGEEAVKRNRRFIITEKSLTYLQGSVGRFDPGSVRLYPTMNDH